MARKKTPLVGKIVWHDLVTYEVDKAMDYYRKLVDWEYEPFDMGPMGTYHMIKVGEKTWGGFMKPPMEGVPPHWMAYTWVDDVEKTAKLVTRMEGKLAVPPTDIPNVGRFLVAQDPQGAVMAFMRGNEPPSADPPRPGPREFCWDELMADDPHKAMGFYGELVGWAFEKREMGSQGEYWVGKRGKHDAVGLMKKPAAVPAPPHWLSYVHVEDLDRTTSRAKELGGKIAMPPMAVTGVGRVSVVMDSLGAHIGLFGDPTPR